MGMPDQPISINGTVEQATVSFQVPSFAGGLGRLWRQRRAARHDGPGQAERLGLPRGRERRSCAGPGAGPGACSGACSGAEPCAREPSAAKRPRGPEWKQRGARIRRPSANRLASRARQRGGLLVSLAGA